MSDLTENIRRQQQEKINSDKRTRKDLEVEYGKCWDTAELQIDFEVLGFLAPYAMVRRKVDNKLGSVLFRHSPRIYFNFKED